MSNRVALAAPLAGALCRVLVALLLTASVSACAQEGPALDCTIDRVPEGYRLHAYDDCGYEGRQPHVLMQDSYLYTFQPSYIDAPEADRSAVFSYKQVNAEYSDLDPKLSYCLVMTYINDRVYNRVQSLWADGVQLHPPLTLPKGEVTKVTLGVPQSVTEDGRMKLEIRIHGEVNATVSVMELWANGEPRGPSLRISSVSAIYPGIMGRVVDRVYGVVAGAEVNLLSGSAAAPIASTTTGPDGWFTIDRKTWNSEQASSGLRLIASRNGEVTEEVRLPDSDVGFTPVRYVPVPNQVMGLRNNEVSLDGKWRINPDPPDDARRQSLYASGWSELTVPGQWLQQGFDIPRDKSVAMAREFAVPEEWAGYRIFLRFDAIHAGTHYWLNGKELGYSEVLFTPVEWDVTDAVRPGQANRLDLRMKVDTVSERLSKASDFTFHNLGGIDRSVRLYAVPQVFVRDLHMSTDLDTAYKDAELKLDLTIENAGSQAISGLGLGVSLRGPGGKRARLSNTSLDIGSVAPGRMPVRFAARVSDPLKWSSEKPNLYKLIIELRNGSEVIERIERGIGFRKIEIRDRQFYVNGKRVKLAGSSHQAMDPLTGRADADRHAEEDMELAKGANLNHMRACTFPPSQELLDACDRLGIYLEVEAPFNWVAPNDGFSDLKEILTPISAMIDYCHTHPCVAIWSIANESTFNKSFELANRLCKELDPSRPTMFNNPDNYKCDIGNMHYPLMPYDERCKDDPRPVFIGEYWFPVCHEQTDVMINPGLRELWGHGHANPNSDWAKSCAESFFLPIQPGAPPGAWEHILNSDHLIGGAMFGLIDEAFYLPGGKHAGYAWSHGYWGLADAWRRTKPEWWLAKLIYSPVRFPERQVSFRAGQGSVQLPVQNRYAFTNLSELRFEWELDGRKGRADASVPPASSGKIEIPVPKGASQGSEMILRVIDSSGRMVNALCVTLGKPKTRTLPKPVGAPDWTDDGKAVSVRGRDFALVLDRAKAEFSAGDGRNGAGLRAFPALHLTRFDFGDLLGGKPPYAELPDASTRVIEEVKAAELPDGLEITVRDHYDGFAGSVTWLIGGNGVGRLSYDYAYSGPDLDVREIGLKCLLDPQCDKLSWRRWSEWGVFPKDHISRTEGSARATRAGVKGTDPEGVKPQWPWSLDQTELGTCDFRGIKFNIYEASLKDSKGRGLEVHADSDAHVRSCLADDGVKLHILSHCRLGPIVLKTGNRVKGEFIVELAHP